jgi:hypothetical protein
VFDLHKTYAYLYLYAFIHKIDVTDLSLTIVETRHPQELIHYLEDVRHFSVEERFAGIYVVTGDVFPLQIIESKKLSASDNLWLKSLGNQLTAEELEILGKERAKQGKEAHLNAYMKAIYQANSDMVREVLRMGNTSLQEVFRELVDEGYFQDMVSEWETRGAIQAEEKKVAEVARKMLLDGQTPESISKWLELPLDKVRQIQQELGASSS